MAVSPIDSFVLEVFTAPFIKITVSWNMTPCSFLPITCCHAP